MNIRTSDTLKRTVVLILARGPAGRFADIDGLKYKALLPVNGRPLADHVLRSLQGSLAEKIFIVQAPDERLQDVFDEAPKKRVYRYRRKPGFPLMERGEIS